MSQVKEKQATASATSTLPSEEKPKLRPGRPRKSTTTTTKKSASSKSASSKDDGADASDAVEEKPKRRPGRPRKSTTVSASKSSSSGGPAESADEGSKRRSNRSRKSTSDESSSREGSDSASSKKKDSGSTSSATSEEAAGGEQSAGKQPAEHGDSDRPRQRKRRSVQDGSGRSDRSGRGSSNQRSGRQSDRSGGGKGDSDSGGYRRQRRQYDNRSRGEVTPSVSKEDLAALKVAELRTRAADLSLDVTGLRKAELVEAVYTATAKSEGFLEVSGVLDILSDGYGFLRADGYLPGEGDSYVGLSVIRRNGLRKGDFIVGRTRPARDNEKFAAIQKVISVNDVPVEELSSRPRFSDLTPIYPDDRLLMEHGKNTTTSRVIDLCAPIGKGQRGLIVSPPKAGKTTVLKDIAASITANNPEVHLMCLLVDERPEEVTDMERSIQGEVVSSTFDMSSENHIAVAELVIERAKRLVEAGRDVVILLDSITRLARAYNLAQPASGRVLSGGVDSTALYPPKRFLGAARNIEGGGSLTILASALIDTGSKMDEVIFEEFKGTGNMELRLDRNLADRRIYPAIDPISSGTRKEELLLDPQEAALIWAVRRILANMNNTERAMDMLIKSLKQTDTNQEFLVRTARKAQTQHGKAEESLEL